MIFKPYYDLYDLIRKGKRIGGDTFLSYFLNNYVNVKSSNILNLIFLISGDSEIALNEFASIEIIIYSESHYDVILEYIDGNNDSVFISDLKCFISDENIIKLTNCKINNLNNEPKYGYLHRDLNLVHNWKWLKDEYSDIKWIDKTNGNIENNVQTTILNNNIELENVFPKFKDPFNK